MRVSGGRLSPAGGHRLCLGIQGQGRMVGDAREHSPARSRTKPAGGDQGSAGALGAGLAQGRELRRVHSNNTGTTPAQERRVRELGKRKKEGRIR